MDITFLRHGIARRRGYREGLWAGSEFHFLRARSTIRYRGRRRRGLAAALGCPEVRDQHYACADRQMRSGDRLGFSRFLDQNLPRETCKRKGRRNRRPFCHANAWIILLQLLLQSLLLLHLFLLVCKKSSR